jgi:pimeloyl-ACP methyl ester carboxylesterase
MRDARASGRTRRGRLGLLPLLPLWAALLANTPAGAAAQAKPATGFDEVAELKTAAFRTPGAPSVIVHAPEGFDPRKPLHLVVFLHGYNGCVNVLMAEGPSRCKAGAPERDGWDLGRQHDAARTNTLFVVPQLALAQRNGAPGAFGKPSGFRAFLEELLSKTLVGRLGGPRRLKDVASLTLVAHSAGYQTALAIAERGGVRVQLKGIVLLDALYADTDRYARFLETQVPKGLRFVSLYLQVGTPRLENQRLYRRLKRSLGAVVEQAESADLARAVASKAVVIGQGEPPHRLLPEKHLAEIVRALGQVYLPQRSAAATQH